MKTQPVPARFTSIATAICLVMALAAPAFAAIDDDAGNNKAPVKPKRFVVLAGNDQQAFASNTSSDGLSPQGFSFEASYDLRQSEVRSSGQWADSVFFDGSIGSQTNLHHNGSLFQDDFGSNDYQSSSQSLFGIGLQRRYYTGGLSRSRFYMGAGAGGYYMEGKQHSYGADEQYESPGVYVTVPYDNGVLHAHRTAFGWKAFAGIEGESGITIQAEVAHLRNLNYNGSYSDGIETIYYRFGVSEMHFSLRAGYRF